MVTLKVALITLKSYTLHKSSTLNRGFFSKDTQEHVKSYERELRTFLMHFKLNKTHVMNNVWINV